MQDTSQKYFLMIEPDSIGNKQSPIEDSITKAVEYLFSLCKTSDYSFKGWHNTRCGASSDNKDWVLPNGMITNSLCVYYVRYYRPFIPQEEMDKIKNLSKQYLNLEL